MSVLEIIWCVVIFSFSLLCVLDGFYFYGKSNHNYIIKNIWIVVKWIIVTIIFRWFIPFITWFFLVIFGEFENSDNNETLMHIDKFTEPENPYWVWWWHNAWRQRAEEKGITDPDDCWGKSDSFIEGCQTYANEYRENQCNDWEDEYCE